MGYYTTYKGELKFNRELTAKDIAILNGYLGRKLGQLTIDLEFNDDYTALRHDGFEKTYDMADAINALMTRINMVIPGLQLEGELLVHIEEYGEHFTIRMIDGIAQETPF